MEAVQEGLVGIGSHGLLRQGVASREQHGKRKERENSIHWMSPETVRLATGQDDDAESGTTAPLAARDSTR